MPQNGSRVIREDSEVPSMSEEKIRGLGYFDIFSTGSSRALSWSLLRKRAGLLFSFLDYNLATQAEYRVQTKVSVLWGLWATYFENGSDFPVGKPLPCVLVSTFPQCTATWQSLCSTILQYSCCRNKKGGKSVSGGMLEAGFHACLIGSIKTLAY